MGIKSYRKTEIVTIGGTRPEIIKLANILPILNKKYNHAFIYTGQHYSDNMKDIFFDELGIIPDYDLESNTSDILQLKYNLLKVLKILDPSYVIVYGDTNSTLAAVLSAQEIKSKIIHIEAGVRDFDLAVPEESNRIKIDSISEYLFAPSRFCETVLTYEQIKGDVFLTGNLIVDVCKRLAEIASKNNNNNNNNNLQQLKADVKDYLLLTIHRPENTDDPIKLNMLAKHLDKVNFKIIFPVHPRTQNSLAKYNIKLPSNIIPISPVGYLDFLYLLNNCKLVMTDSGGVQEEAIVLKKPCITLRHTSARWETILLKANILFPLDRQDSLNTIIESMIPTKININPYGENVTKSTLDILNKIIKKEIHN